MNQHYDSTRKTNIFPKRLLLVLALIVGYLPAMKAQSVIMYGDYYLKHGTNGQNVETASSTGFNPSTCIWYLNNNTVITANASGEAYSGNYFLQTGSVSLGNSATWTQAQNGSTMRATSNNYLRRRSSNGNWQISNSTGSRATAYAVTIGSNINGFSILGDATISATGTNSSYSHTNANYYDTYTFNGSTYYSTDPSAASSTTAPTSGLPTLTTGYTWSISANSYATVNTSTGAITVNSLPSTDTNVTLSCSVTRNGVTQTANKTITIEAPKVNPTSITVTTPMTVYVGQTANIAYALSPTPCYNYVTYNSNSTSIATVDNNGVVTGVALGSTSITVTAHKIDGTTNAALTGVVTVNVRNKVATPAINFAQIGDGSTATASISCATPGVTINYKVNGESYSAYSTSFTVNEHDEVWAYAVKTGEGSSFWDNSDVAHETYVSCSTSAPRISYIQSGTTANVTITAEAGATIYYTYGANPGDPTPDTPTSGSTPVTINNVANGTVVKAIAKNSSCAASGVVSETIILSGVSGGVVTLNDREDHNWSYYQPTSALPDGYPKRLSSPYPRNVKITYYGYGDNTLSTSEVAAPAASTFSNNTSSSDVKVGIGEDGHTFVYYKTLERDANGLYPYELIPNPFYVRPKSGSTYTGFYKWRVKSVSGGSISNAGGTTIATTSTVSTDNVWLDAEVTYYFNPSDNGETNVNNVTSMTVELEAMWAAAEISTGNTPSFSNGYNSVERNFYVGSGGLFSSTTPCTYSSFYPNGTTNGSTAVTVTNGTVNGRQTKASGSAQADSKVEYMILTGNTDADAHNLTLGRGVGASNTSGNFYPVDEDKSTDLDFRLRIESGIFNAVYLMSNGHSYKRFQNHFVFGSDYDRAKGDNSKLDVAPGNTNSSTNNIVKFGTAVLDVVNKDNPTLTCIIKSGQFHRGHWEDNNNAQYNYGVYCCGDCDNTSYPGLTSLTVEGGHFASIIGGRGNYTVGCITEDSLAYTLRFRGGLVENSVYGASSNNATYGSRRLIFTGGEVRGWIAAGCNGTSDTDERGQTRGDSYVYVGGNTKVGNADYPRTNNSAVGGNVFGAGRGGNRQYASIKTSHVAVADNAEVLYDVYGGGFHGHIVNTSNIFVFGGIVHGRVFGGGDNNGNIGNTIDRSIPRVNISMTGGVVESGLYGGSNTTGIVTEQVTLKINGGQVGTTSATANINGGGYGNDTRVNGNVDVTLGVLNQTEEGVTVYGDVYGGSALGHVNGGANGTTASDTYHTYVTLNKGTINGSLYGGGLGDSSTEANVYGPVQVKVYGGSVRNTDGTGENGSGGVYGANNINGAPRRSVTVDIYGTDPAPATDEYALFAVYGGGNQADYTYGNGYPQVTVHNCNNSIEYVYGGGNAAAVASTNVTIYGGNKIGTVFGGGNGRVREANVTGSTVANIYGGSIGQVFGGSNSSGTIGNSITVNVNKQNESGHDACAMKIGEVYGGGNMAASQAGSISIVCTGDFDTGSNGHAHCNTTDNRIGYELEGIGAVYGGANAAEVTGNITLNITGGMIYRVFGGNNTSNTVDGEIVVNINKGSSTCGWYVGYVYGGGNNAPYSREGQTDRNYPKVNILAGTVSHDVFGAGKGVEASVVGNPVVTLSGNSVVGGDVYGGGDQGAVTGETKVEIKD